MPAANLGPKSPLPELHGYKNASSVALPGAEAIPETDWMDKGSENMILPYRMQDEYDRERKLRPFKSAVLENDFLKATFMLEYNARLWSLIHKPSGRELLYANPVFQPGNVSIRNAWITGGVEWNIGIFGHSVFTLSPLFAAEFKSPDGSPGLRVWEYERIRRVAFQIDFWLPNDSQFLMARPRIYNQHSKALPMYWWSNIAVVEYADQRVVAPTEESYRHAYDGKMVVGEWPNVDGVDFSYTTRRDSAGDAYFRIPKTQRPWVAAVDGEGKGLIHASTSRLCGRKMWNWGVGRGSRRWQHFLSSPDSPGCIEMQGGLSPTQGMYIPLPAKTTWDWVEAYGMIDADPKIAHGEWRTAYKHVDQRLNAMLPVDALEKQLTATNVMADKAPGKMLFNGTGWGALENKRRAKAGEASLPAATPFPDDSMDADQAPWLELLNTGALPNRPADQAPGAFMVQPEFHRLLEESVAKGKSDHWLGWYHLGVMRWRAGDIPGATAAWETSLKRQRTPWALRNLAVMAQNREEPGLAADLIIEAVRMCPNLLQLVINACNICSDAERSADLLKLLDLTTPRIRAQGRVRYLEAKAALKLGRHDILKKFFDELPPLVSVREAEMSLTDLWFEYQTQLVAQKRGVEVTESLRDEMYETLTPPEAIDFRMHGRKRRKPAAHAAPAAPAPAAAR